MGNHLLSLAVDQEGTFVALHANVAGLDLLIKTLSRLRQVVAEGNCEDIHLFADSDLGGELTSTKLEDSSLEVSTIQQLKLYGWTDEWARRHDLLD